MNIFFITGTDTDCGKTYVTSRLLNDFPDSAAIKPVASGCKEIDNQLVSDDALELQKHCKLSLDIINPWRFRSPVSPHIAAKEEGYRLSARAIADYCFSAQPQGVKSLFIEGAGGLMVPLNENETWIDFLQLTQIPVLLVVGMKLGCINHALLTQTALEVNQIKCMGWIANCLDPEMKSISDNIATLTSALKFPHLATFPFSANQ